MRENEKESASTFEAYEYSSSSLLTVLSNDVLIHDFMSKKDGHQRGPGT